MYLLDIIVIVVIPIAAYFLFVVRPNLKKARALRDVEPLTEEQIKHSQYVKHSLSEAPQYIRITQSTFQKIDMSVECNEELFRVLTLFNKALFKESSDWRETLDGDYSIYFHLDERQSTIINSLIPALEIIKNNFIELQDNRKKLIELNDAIINEIELMKKISEQLEYGVPATHNTILEALSKVVLGVVFHEKELNSYSLSELEKELNLYDDLRIRESEHREGIKTYEEMYNELYTIKEKSQDAQRRLEETNKNKRLDASQVWYEHHKSKKD